MFYICYEWINFVIINEIEINLSTIFIIEFCSHELYFIATLIFAIWILFSSFCELFIISLVIEIPLAFQQYFH